MHVKLNFVHVTYLQSLVQVTFFVTKIVARILEGGWQKAKKLNVPVSGGARIFKMEGGGQVKQLVGIYKLSNQII